MDRSFRERSFRTFAKGCFIELDEVDAEGNWTTPYRWNYAVQESLDRNAFSFPQADLQSLMEIAANMTPSTIVLDSGAASFAEATKGVLGRTHALANRSEENYLQKLFSGKHTGGLLEVEDPTLTPEEDEHACSINVHVSDKVRKRRFLFVRLKHRTMCFLDFPMPADIIVFCVGPESERDKVMAQACSFASIMCDVNFRHWARSAQSIDRFHVQYVQYLQDLVVIPHVHVHCAHAQVQSMDTKEECEDITSAILEMIISDFNYADDAHKIHERTHLPDAFHLFRESDHTECFVSMCDITSNHRLFLHRWHNGLQQDYLLPDTGKWSRPHLPHISVPFMLDAINNLRVEDIHLGVQARRPTALYKIAGEFLVARMGELGVSTAEARDAVAYLLDGGDVTPPEVEPFEPASSVPGTPPNSAKLSSSSRRKSFGSAEKAAREYEELEHMKRERRSSLRLSHNWCTAKDEENDLFLESETVWPKESVEILCMHTDCLEVGQQVSMLIRLSAPMKTSSSANNPPAKWMYCVVGPTAEVDCSFDMGRAMALLFSSDDVFDVCEKCETAAAVLDRFHKFLSHVCLVPKAQSRFSRAGHRVTDFAYRMSGRLQKLVPRPKNEQVAKWKRKRETLLRRAKHGPTVFHRTLAIIQQYSLPLLLGVIVALIFSNASYEDYEYVTGANHHGDKLVLTPGFQIFKHDVTLHFLANDIFMVFFFGLAAKEVTESFLPGGSLNPIKRAVSPLLGTVGGVLVPVAFYLCSVVVFWHAGNFDSLSCPETAEHGGDATGAGADHSGHDHVRLLASETAECEDVTLDTLLMGWGVPTATDISLAWMVATTVFGVGHAAIDFLLLLAVVDDGIGLLIIAIFYPDPEHPVDGRWLGLIPAAMLLAFTLRKLNFAWWQSYIFTAGVVSWIGLLLAHVHPSLALVPIMPFLPHTESTRPKGSPCGSRDGPSAGAKVAAITDAETDVASTDDEAGSDLEAAAAPEKGGKGAGSDPPPTSLAKYLHEQLDLLQATMTDKGSPPHSPRPLPPSEGKAARSRFQGMLGEEKALTIEIEDGLSRKMAQKNAFRGTLLPLTHDNHQTAADAVRAAAVEMSAEKASADADGAHEHANAPLHKFEHDMKVFVDLGLFFFSFANAGVQVSAPGGVTISILLGLVVGKTLGIAGFTIAGEKLFNVRLPEGVTYPDLFMVGFIASMGLTVALFVSGEAFVDARLAEQAKMGAILSGIVGIIAILVGKQLGWPKASTAQANPDEKKDDFDDDFIINTHLQKCTEEVDENVVCEGLVRVLRKRHADVLFKQGKSTEIGLAASRRKSFFL